MKNYASLRKIITYLSQPELITDFQKKKTEILASFPDEDLKIEIEEVLTTVAAQIEKFISASYPNSEINFSKVRPHIQYLSSIYIGTRMQRLYDKLAGLNVRRRISIEDYTKIRVNRLTSSLASPNNLKTTIRKSKSRSAQISVKSLDRVRGIKLSSLLKTYKPAAYESTLLKIIPADIDRAGIEMESQLYLFRVIADIIRRLDLHYEHHLVSAASYWTNLFLLQSRKPLPTRNVFEFCKEMSASTIESYIINNTEQKFDAVFWKDSIYKRKKQDLVTRHQTGITGPLSFNDSESTEECLAYMTTIQLVLLMNLLRLRLIHTKWPALGLNGLSRFMSDDACSK